MVPVGLLREAKTRCFQYSLCRVVLMVGTRRGRTDCSIGFQYSLCRVVLMVAPKREKTDTWQDFQYSLCRVVLMVHCKRTLDYLSVCVFQYSLCRVVLMVICRFKAHHPMRWLSVLALSSRFDGRGCAPAPKQHGRGFQYSLCRVVLMVNLLAGCNDFGFFFQYSLCRVVLMVI